jgi:hypothetical protein
MQRRGNTFDGCDEFISQVVSCRSQGCSFEVAEGLSIITTSLDWGRHRQCDSRGSESKNQRSEVHCKCRVTSGCEIVMLLTRLNTFVVFLSCYDVLPAHHSYWNDRGRRNPVFSVFCNVCTASVFHSRYCGQFCP